MFMSAIAYNLKRYLKFTQKLAESKSQTQEAILSVFKSSILPWFIRYEVLKKCR